MKLLELKIEPVEVDGWESELLTFGDDITQLYGPNGCGKTPVIHSIAYAMGYPVRYRDDIQRNCKSILLKASHKEKIIVFKRELSSSFNIECQISEKSIDGETNDINSFYNEKDFSLYLLNLLGLSTAALTSVKNMPTYPYISTFLPLFYVDQDLGYTSAYKSQSNFIKDQYAEMVRMSIGVAAKNSYEKKKHLIENKNELNSVDSEIVSTEKFIETLMLQRKGSLLSSIDIEDRLQKLKDRLDELNSNQDTSYSSKSAIQTLINENLSEKNKVNSRIKDLEERISGFSKIKEEIEIEINTLSLNEEAKRIFTSFNEICSNKGCQLFLSSSKSYGKNLLYLKDQIKDLDRNLIYQEERLEEFRLNFDKLKGEIRKLKINLSDEQSAGSTQNLVNTISELTRSIIDLQKEKEIVKRLELEERKYSRFLDKREQLHNAIASLDDRNTTVDLKHLKFRTDFKKQLREWLDVLSTKNISNNITIDSDFNILFGTEKLSQLSGSTLLRVILAIKAAFFDIYISSELSAFEFLIFDTPKQHDIETEHFAAFINKLKTIVTKKRAQIIFSTTEYHYNSRGGDTEWIPNFPGTEQNMFLGVIPKNV
ncbi:hypothetical protein SAMN05444411_102228 [Lutibacter oricola]|uniref:AAA domain-containing protein n=1 Tax=Lutibacter oricola TaxID=762486 RepID=A0A1H2WLF1_9FLAO|nr:hypothetical protein [Lutibacter oricola]SDW81306.1 hypothetical protein SAMN05444411_102228 [Lutibacter oricola]